MSDWNKLVQTLIEYAVTKEISRVEIIKSEENEWDLIIKLNYGERE